MNAIIFNSILKGCNLITKVNNDLRNFQNREKRYGKTNQLVLNMMLKKCVHLKAEIETSNHHQGIIKICIREKWTKVNSRFIYNSHGKTHHRTNKIREIIKTRLSENACAFLWEVIRSMERSFIFYFASMIEVWAYYDNQLVWFTFYWLRVRCLSESWYLFISLDSSHHGMSDEYFLNLLKTSC